jgi:hypothetical protein
MICIYNNIYAQIVSKLEDNKVYIYHLEKQLLNAFTDSAKDIVHFTILIICSSNDTLKAKEHYRNAIEIGRKNVFFVLKLIYI